MPLSYAERLQILLGNRIDESLKTELWARVIKGLEGVPSDSLEDLRKHFEWALTHLRRRDRLEWWVRWLRLWVLHRLFDSEWRNRNNEWGAKFVAEAERYARRAGLSFMDIPRETKRFDPREMEQEFQHFYSLGLHGIDAYVFQWQLPDRVISDFKTVEEAWKRETKGFIDEDAQVEEEGPAEDYLVFADGWKWRLLHYESSEMEAAAMGHCGNTASPKTGDEILSLREPKKRGGRTLWEPHATFIVNDGWLGEMKGKNNDKPVPKYHPYIAELLKSDIVKGIVGGGYAPENNFAMEDLDRDLHDQVVKAKPMLLGIRAYFRQYGMTKDLQDGIEMILGLHYDEDRRNKTSDEKTICEWKDGGVVVWRGTYEQFVSTYILRGHELYNWAVIARDNPQEVGSFEDTGNDLEEAMKEVVEAAVHDDEAWPVLLEFLEFFYRDDAPHGSWIAYGQAVDAGEEDPDTFVWNVQNIVEHENRKYGKRGDLFTALSRAVDAGHATGTMANARAYTEQTRQAIVRRGATSPYGGRFVVEEGMAGGDPNDPFNASGAYYLTNREIAELLGRYADEIQANGDLLKFMFGIRGRDAAEDGDGPGYGRSETEYEDFLDDLASLYGYDEEDALRHFVAEMRFRQSRWSRLAQAYAQTPEYDQYLPEADLKRVIQTLVYGYSYNLGDGQRLAPSLVGIDQNLTKDMKVYIHGRASASYPETAKDLRDGVREMEAAWKAMSPPERSEAITYWEYIVTELGHGYERVMHKKLPKPHAIPQNLRLAWEDGYDEAGTPEGGAGDASAGVGGQPQPRPGV
jgi:hypothetical protein